MYSTLGMYRVEITRPERGLLEVQIALTKTIMAAKIFLGFFVVLCFLGPVVAAIFIGSDLRPGFLVSMLIMFAIGFWFLRVLLWNTYGKEVFHLSPGKLSIVNDYKLFKAPRVTLDTATLDISYIITDTEINEAGIEIKEGFFIFRLDKKVLSSSVKLPEHELVYTVKAIRDYLETNPGNK